uniref:Glucan endo-1,3-beta-glucosidase n=1 Tax=Talaromyces marneffei PM1 TaxID=1077442 RepID=A0A093V1W2_TALMA
MRGLAKWTVALAALIVGQALASPLARGLPGPVQVTPNPNGSVVGPDNFLGGYWKGNTTNRPGTNKYEHRMMEAAASSSGILPIELVNNIPGSSPGSVNAYIQGRDTAGNIVFVRADGSFYYPPGTASGVPVPITENIAIPLGGQGSTTTVTILNFLISGRVYLARGDLKFFMVSGGLVQPSPANPSDPSANIDWGFIELTNDPAAGLFANISYVDFIGMILGMSLTSTDGSVQTALGLKSNAVQDICSHLVAQTSIDGQPWASLCETSTSGDYIRILSPNLYISTHPDAFANYWTYYVNNVYSRYASQPLTINTQSGPGNVHCTTGGSDTMTCVGSDVNFPKPNARDIFGCNSGPFVVRGNIVDALVVPRLCAAFNRGTLLLPGGDVQPSLSADHYYTTSPSNFYSKFVHGNEVDGKGYAFPYDDVNPDGENASGLLSSPNPRLLRVTVGGPSS